MNDTSVSQINVDQELYPALIQCFFIIIAGYIAGQLGLLTSIQAAGLSRYIGNFALPAVVFKNLVDIQFASVSWGFLGSVFIAKAFVFFATALITTFGVRPRNYASIGLYAIMTSQSNDFALMAPIINAVYKDSHPDYQRYLYLVAPISLVILNPIGIFLIEIQNRLDEQRKNPNASTGSRWQVIRKILLNIIKNPIVICTILGVIFNRIFHEKLPNILEQILTPIAQSFSATALFYLGITMVGKLRQFHSSLIITVLLLSMMKLIVCPLILRQAVYLLVKPSNGSERNVIDFSDFGFLFGTAPTAPSIIFYIPDSNTALQAVASTGLVVVTILAGPIMLISAKMINLNSLDTNVTQVYEANLERTGYDVSLISLFCTVIVLIGFCLRRRLLQVSFMHKYTFIFVGIQFVHAIWTVAIQFIKQPITDSAATVVSLGKNRHFTSYRSMKSSLGTTFMQLTTRTWAASLTLALMISICYSVDRARRYFWVYHLFGWLIPMLATGIIYLISKLAKPKEVPMLKGKNFETISTSVSMITLILCISIILVSLLRFARRIYRVNRIAQERRESSVLINETQPLLNDESEIENSQRAIPSTSSSKFFFRLIFSHELFLGTKSIEINAQPLRHAVLLGLMCINMIIVS